MHPGAWELPGAWRTWECPFLEQEVSASSGGGRMVRREGWIGRRDGEKGWGSWNRDEEKEGWGEGEMGRRDEEEWGGGMRRRDGGWEGGGEGWREGDGDGEERYEREFVC